jgi:hypothetical protein
MGVREEASMAGKASCGLVQVAPLSVDLLQ